jgi:tripartite-type tricarboxylate transporter receptor subunit TctC
MTCPQTRSTLKRGLTLFFSFALLLFSAAAAAQGYPERPVRLVVGFPPGGSSDTVARVVAQHLSPLLGQPVVVENRPGAGGVIGSDIVAKSAPDGHTLLLATAGHSTAAAMMQKLPFDAVKDFAWVSTITTYPFVIATAADSPIKSLPDLIARAKAAPGKLTYSSAGVGTSHHLLGEWLGAEAGIEMVHVPFKGGTSPLTEVLAGRVDVMVETMTLVLPHIKSGKLRGLAVTSPQAMDYLPTCRRQRRPCRDSFSSPGSASPPLPAPRRRSCRSSTPICEKRSPRPTSSSASPPSAAAPPRWRPSRCASRCRARSSAGSSSSRAARSSASSLCTGDGARAPSPVSSAARGGARSLR